MNRNFRTVVFARPEISKADRKQPKLNQKAHPAVCLDVRCFAPRSVWLFCAILSVLPALPPHKPPFDKTKRHRKAVP